MPFLTQLADVARRTGYPVVEVSGWKSRGHGEQASVRGVVCHHTAGWNDRHVVVNGRPGLDGPLSHFWLSRTGEIHVVAAGRCWHNAPSTSAYHTNSASIGIEAENDGRAPWPAAQLDAYKRLCAELCKAFDLPASRVKGHKEVNSGKPDPHSINMNSFRADVARLITGDDDMTPEQIFKAVWFRDGIPVSYGSEENPEWQARSVLVNHGEWLRKIAKKIDEQDATIRSLNATMARLEAALDRLAKGV